MPVHIDPADCIAFTKIHGEFVTSHWADVGIVPYRISANLYCFTNFVRKADSPRPSTLFSFLYQEKRQGRRRHIQPPNMQKIPFPRRGFFYILIILKSLPHLPLKIIHSCAMISVYNFVLFLPARQIQKGAAPCILPLTSGPRFWGIWSPA